MSHRTIVVAATFLLLVDADVIVSPEISPTKDARLVVLKGSSPGIIQEYCLATNSTNPYIGSKVEMAACNGRDSKQLFLVDKNRWRLAADPSLCVDANQAKRGSSLYLQDCKGGEIGNARQKWRFGSVIRTGANWGMCPALAIGTPEPGAPVKTAYCRTDEGKLFYFDMPAATPGEICRKCEDLYGIGSDDICKMRPNRYCQFYVNYVDSDGTCKDYCEEHGGGRCKRSYTNKNGGKCNYKKEVECDETMHDGICRCSLPANCIHADQGQDIPGASELDPSKYYHIVPIKSCPFCTIYDDEGEGDKIVARDRGRFAVSTNFCNNGSFFIEELDEQEGIFRFRKIHKFDNVPTDECLAWTEDWWCTDDDEPTVGELSICNKDGKNRKQLWQYDAKTLAIKSVYDDSFCLEYAQQEVQCAVGHSIYLRTCDGSNERQMWKFLPRTCPGE